MDVRLPNLGEGVDSGSVVSLFVKEGDVIAKGQTLLELENEKAVAPIPSPADGRVTAIRVKPGDKLTVGQVILSLDAASAPGKVAPAPAAAAPSAGTARAAAEVPQAVAPPQAGETAPEHHDDFEPSVRTAQRAGFPPPASPSIRKLSKDLGIDLTRVRGSEQGGRIVLQDVRNYIQQLQQLATSSRIQPVRAPAAEPVDFAKWGPVSTKPLSPLRAVISRRMMESWTTIPHVTQFDEADVTAVTELRKKYAPKYETQGVRLTVTSFILKSVARVLKSHPPFNTSLDETAQRVVFKEYVHLGVAVDTEAGLLVPVIRDADTKSLLQLSKDLQEFADKARERKLAMDDMRGGTFTISNQGGIGSGHFTPIINKPEAAILGLGRSALKPVARDSQVVARMLLPLALSYDHRLIDGAQAARFMVDLVKAIEGFDESEVKL